MIKNNNLNLIPKSMGITKIIKTFKGTDLVWEVIKVDFEGSTKSSYTINISNTSAIKPGKVYTFTTSEPYNNYKLVVDGKEYSVKNGTTFTVDYNCEIKISSLSYKYFDIKIYEAGGQADIKIEKAEILEKTISWSSDSQLSPFATSITIYDDNIIKQLDHRYIIDVTIGNYGKIEIGSEARVRGTLMINFGGSLDELLGVTDFIPRGTKITVRYKEE